MWLIFFLLFYFLPVFYVFFRFLSLGVGKFILTVFTVSALAFPLCQILARKFNLALPDQLLEWLYYFLPYLLYLFLLLFFYDLLMVFNRLFKFIPVSVTKQTKYRRFFLAVLLIIPLIVETYGIINYNEIKINTYNVRIPARNSSLEHLRIVVAADFHLQQSTPTTFMPRFVEMVNAIEPDLVLLPGDITEVRNINDRVCEFAEQFLKLKSRFGIYGCFGNHEWYGDNRNAQILFKQAGIHMLNDEALIMDGLFSIVGRNDNFIKDRMPLSQLLSKVPDNLPVILMDHKPNDLTKVSNHNVDIQVSGHTHNGQLFPFQIVTSLIFELSWGHKQINNTHFFVTSGIRGWGPAVRTSGDAEIMLINVELQR